MTKKVLMFAGVIIGTTIVIAIAFAIHDFHIKREDTKLQALSSLFQQDSQGGTLSGSDRHFDGGAVESFKLLYAGEPDAIKSKLKPRIERLGYELVCPGQDESFINWYDDVTEAVASQNKCRIEGNGIRGTVWFYSYSSETMVDGAFAF